MSPVDLTDLLERLGPAWPEVAALTRLDESIWLVELQGEVAFSLEWRDEAPQIALSAPLGRPPLDRRFVVYESLLMFNALRHENEGATLGLDGPDGELTLLAEAPLAEGTDLPALIALLERFAAHVRQWQAYVNLPAEQLELPAPEMLMFSLRA
jgi:hypothetical protein